MTLTRRHFLQTSGAFTLGLAGLHGLVGCSDMRYAARFGPLVPDPEGIFDLPRGFTYRVISRAGERMTDGFYVPAAHDGMAAFPGQDGRTILVRNHEMDLGRDPAHGPFGSANELFARLSLEDLYDAGHNGQPCLGGTTTLVYDTMTQELVSHYLSLAGTLRNCAGGPTPWNSWITCEETVDLPGEHCARAHGYPFEVPVTATPGLARPVPLTAMGRFNHEAVAVCPNSGVVYQTEDQSDGLLYRFLPDTPGMLANGGRLQALAVAGQSALDTRNWGPEPAVAVGAVLATRWIDLDEVEAPENDLRYRGFDLGAARFARGEGMWYGNDAVYFACTNGGEAERGQIWRYVPSPNEGAPQESEAPGTLELFVEPNDPGLVDNADNLTVTPWGDLILCEDGSGEQFLVGIKPDGTAYKFARNAVSNSELAGATFSPDGTTLFVNIQHDGLTLAITGPWG